MVRLDIQGGGATESAGVRRRRPQRTGAQASGPRRGRPRPAGVLVAAALTAASFGSRPVAAQEPEVPVIEHQALRCLLKDRFALVEAYVRPAAWVTRARVYFTSSAGDEYYSVDLRRAGDDERFEARLPKPKSKAGPAIYFLEVVSGGGELQRTPEVKVEVVPKASACPEPERVGATAEGGDVELYASTPRPVKPKGFGGVARVVVPAAAVPSETAGTPAPAASAVPVAEASAPAPREGEPPAAQAPPAPEPSPSPGTSSAAPSGPVEYAVGPDDIVKVVVVGHDDLAPTLLVQSDGTFIFPLIGRVKVADLTPRQIEALLASRLAHGYIRDPQVSVTVQEYRSKTVMVMGEVARPGPYPLSGSLRIIEMLAKAGMTTSAGSEVQVIRPLGPSDRPLLPSEVAGAEGAALTADKQAEILKVDLRAIQLGDLDKNIPLRPNDTVFVPPAARFYVTGEARSPGAYTLSAGITVREAVILAGGFTENASTGRTRVIREVDGQKREIKVRLEDPVQPGDIIVVKGKLF